MESDNENTFSDFLVKSSFISGITGLSFILILFITIFLTQGLNIHKGLIYISRPLLIISLLSGGMGFLLGITGLIVSKFIPLQHTWKSKRVIGMASGFIAFLLSYPSFIPSCLTTMNTKIKRDFVNIANALEFYKVDYNTYPLPDYDDEGMPILPKSLTTPIAYFKELPYDPFKHNGRGIYGYAMDTHYGWIIKSNGPDNGDGIFYSSTSTEPFPIQKAVSDELLGFPLQQSRFTFDPTNGPTSAGDIWRRGP